MKQNVLPYVPMKITLLKLLFLLWFFGCNSVFYYPDHNNYVSFKDIPFLAEEHFISSQTNSKIHLWHIFSKKKAKGTIVHFHGNAQNLTAHIGFSIVLPNEGYDLIIFDYQGYGKSEGEPSRENSVFDGLEVLKFAESHKRSGPLFVLGQSLGGAIAPVSVSLFGQEKIKAFAIESSFSSYRQMAKSKLAAIWITWLFQWPLSFLVTDTYSSEEVLTTLKMPMFIAHGSADEVVPIEEGEKVFKLSGSVEKRWLEIKNGEHTPLFNSKHRTEYKQFIAWLNEQSERGPIK